MSEKSTTAQQDGNKKKIVVVDDDAINHGLKSTNNDAIPPHWYEVFQDATELESLIFCVRRPTARDKLFRLVDNLKKLSGKLKRYEEVTSQFDDNTMSSSFEKFVKKRAAVDATLLDENQKAKKPRAIPLDLFGDNNNSSQGRNGDSSLWKAGQRSDVESPEQEGSDFSTPQTIDPTLQVPLLKNRDKWVKHHQRKSNLHCPDFEASNSCPLGSKCDYLHIFTPKEPHMQTEKDGIMIKIRYTKEDVERAYQSYRKIALSKNDYSEKIKNNEFNLPTYCCCITCPIDRTIYYAQPFPGERNVKGNKSSQGIWWYTDMKDAKESVATQIIVDWKGRGIVPMDFMPYDFTSNAEMDKLKAVQKATELARKTMQFESTPSETQHTNNVLPETLPDIVPLNFMESNYEQRCAQFNTPRGCPYGSRCHYAHVYYPSEIDTDGFPDREALTYAYRENFQLRLQDPFFLGQPNGQSFRSPFRVMTAVDENGGLWYTAAMQCPHEGIIYYAAGGNTGQLNKQNIVLYPTIEHAKLAVAGVILNSFKKRGLVGKQKISQQHDVVEFQKSSIAAPSTPYENVAPCQPHQRMQSLLSHRQGSHMDASNATMQRHPPGLVSSASNRANASASHLNQNDKVPVVPLPFRPPPPPQNFKSLY